MPEKKSILFILPDMNQGGAERIVANLLIELEHSDYDTYLLLLRKEGYYINLLPKSVQIIDINSPRIRHSIFKILKVIRQIKPDLVFGGFGEVNAFLSPFIKFFPKTKFIARETNVVSEHVQRKEIRFFYRFYNLYQAIVAQSKDMKTDLIQNLGIREEKISRIPNPVNFNYINEKKDEFFPREFQNNSKNVVAIGNLSKRKGFDQLLKVFEFLKSAPIQLFIIGEGPDKEELEAIKKEKKLENVHFLGRRENPYPYLKNADLFVLSSRYEGFPNVLLEAGACGTFSIANNCKGGVDEIIIPGINGEIADITYYENFANAIKETLNQNHDKEAIIESIKSRYNQDIIFKKYLQLFDRLSS